MPEGLFWTLDVDKGTLTRGGGEDAREKTKRTRVVYVRERPPVPSTGWVVPTELPSLAGAKIISLDTETYDPGIQQGRGPAVRQGGYIAGFSVGTDDGYRRYFPLRHKGSSLNLDPAKVMAWARVEFGRGNQPKVGHNLLYDLDYFAEEGVEVKGQLIDTGVAEALIDERGRYSLEAIAQKYLGEGKVMSVLEDWASQAFGEKEWKGHMEECPPELVGPYAEGDVDLPLRVYEKQRLIIEKEELDRVFSIESRLIPMLLAMRRRGVRINVEAAHNLDTQLLEIRDGALDELTKLTGYAPDIWSAASVSMMFDNLKIEYPHTPTGLPSFTKKWLTDHPHPAAQLLQRARKADKFKSTFIDGHIFGSLVGDRIHTQFHQLKSDENGTISGRLCVHGDTLLETSRGEFAIRDYEVQIGDTIVSHLGRQCQILRKYYKGKELMYRVELANGAYIIGTRGHRVLTPSGWVSLGELQNIPIYTYGNFKKLPQQPSQDSQGAPALPVTSQTNSPAGCFGNADWISDYPSFGQDLSSIRRVHTREGIALFEKQEGGEQSHDWESPGRTSQLEGRDTGRRWIPDGQSGEDLRAHSRSGISQALGIEGNSPRVSRSSHRRGQTKLPPGQPLSRNEEGASKFTPEISKVVSVTALGPCDVWDIEVENDHSYLAQGFIHHNSSSDPNLQNIPIRDKVLGPLLRALFIPDPGRLWWARDWSQVEYRLLGHFAVLTKLPGAEAMAQMYRTNLKTDFHQMLADLTGLSRSDAKNTNFAQVYGQGLAAFAAAIGKTIEEAKVIRGIYHERAPYIKALEERVKKAANDRGYIKTILGRRRRYSFWEDWDKNIYSEPGTGRKRAYLNSAVNALIQGSAADAMKIAMVQQWEAGVYQYLGGAPLLTVHDELDGDYDPNDRLAKQALAEVHRIMETCITLEVPLLAEGGEGENWAKAK